MAYGFSKNKVKVDVLEKNVDEVTTGSIKAKAFSGSSFNIDSARKFKENIHPTVINGLDTINKAEVVDYNYITDLNKDPKVGLIADDCPAILATADRLGLDTNNCIGVLIKAVQELSDKVEILEAR